MSYSNIHQTLDFWSHAKSFQELANLVLEKNKISSPLSIRDIQDAHNKIKKFIEDYSDQLFSYDLPALNKLRHIATSNGQLNNPRIRGQEHRVRIGTIFANAILSAKNNKTALANIPQQLNPIIESYLPLSDKINLAIIDQTQPPVHPLTPDSSDIKDFIENLKERYTCKEFHIFDSMIKTFFRQSSTDTQTEFFHSIPLLTTYSIENIEKRIEEMNNNPEYAKKRKRNQFFGPSKRKVENEIITLVLTSIPQDSPQLNFTHLMGRNKEIMKIIGNSYNLQTLYLPCGFDYSHHTSYLRELNNLTMLKNLFAQDLSARLLIDLSRNPNINLARLEISSYYSPNGDPDAIKIFVESPYSTNLEELTIDRAKINRENCLALTNSTFKGRLRCLSLRCCHNLSDENFQIIMRTQFSNIEKFDFSYNHSLTDTAVHALIEYLTNKTTNCAYRDALQHVIFNDCANISSEVKDKLEAILQKNRTNESEETLKSEKVQW